MEGHYAAYAVAVGQCVGGSLLLALRPRPQRARWGGLRVAPSLVEAGGQPASGFLRSAMVVLCLDSVGLVLQRGAHWRSGGDAGGGDCGGGRGCTAARCAGANVSLLQQAPGVVYPGACKYFHMHNAQAGVACGKKAC